MQTAEIYEEPAVSELQLIPGIWKSLGQIAAEFREAAESFYRSSGFSDLSELLGCYADLLTPLQFVRLFKETFSTISVPYVLDYSIPFHKANLFKWVDLFRRHSRRFDFDSLVQKEFYRTQLEVNIGREWLDSASWWKPLESVMDDCACNGGSDMVRLAA